MKNKKDASFLLRTLFYDYTNQAAVKLRRACANVGNIVFNSDYLYCKLTFPSHIVMSKNRELIAY